MTRFSALVGVLTVLSLAAPAHAGAPGTPVPGLGELGRSECIDLPVVSPEECGNNYLEGMALTPDGRYVYVPTAKADAVHVLRRTSSGRVRRLAGTDGCVALGGEAVGCRPARGLRGARRVSVSADGRSLYVSGHVSDPSGTTTDTGHTGPGSSTIAVFAIDPASGALTQLPGTEGCLAIGGSDGAGNACTPARGVARLGAPRPSPDGRNVYATFIGTAVFRRDEATGALTQLPGPDGCVLPAPADPTSGCAEARGVENALDTAVSPDGRNVYLPNPVEGSDLGKGGVASFARDESTGAIRQLEGPAGCHAADGRAGCTPVPERADGTSLALSPDGTHLYLLGAYAFATYSRDGSTGALAYTGCTSAYRDLRDCTFTPDALTDEAGLAFAPDGRTAYSASADDEDALLTFARDPGTGRLTEVACTSTAVTKRCLDLADAAPSNLAVAPDGMVVARSGSSVSTMRPGLALPAGPVAVDRRGAARFRVRCDSPAGPCAGRLRIGSAGAFGTARLTLATGRYSVPQNGSATVTLTFTRAGRSGLQLERKPVYPLAAATRSGDTTITTRRSIRFVAPARGFAPAFRPERSGRCLPPHAQTLARTATARLYLLRKREGLVYVYGCLNSVGRGFALEDFDELENGHTFLTPYALAGRYVAFHDNYLAGEGAEEGVNDTYVRVVDLGTGRTVRQACAEPDCIEPVDDLALAPSGAVAWIAAKRVWRLSGTRKKPERLGGGTGLDIESLKLSGSRLTWREDGRTRAATLR